MEDGASVLFLTFSLGAQDFVKRIVLFSLFGFSIVGAFYALFSCSVKKKSDEAFLEIKSLKINGKTVGSDCEIELKGMDVLNSSDIKATFAYNKIEGEVELPVTLLNEPIPLKKGVPVRVDLYVPYKPDEYQGWQGYFNAILR